MPQLSPTMETGKLAKWHVKEGDEVRSGDIIAEIETDKATMEVEAVDEGRIGKLLVPEGAENVPVNQPIAILLEDGEGASSFDTPPAATPHNEVTPAAKGETHDGSPEHVMNKIAEQIRANGSNGHGSRIFASPLARRLARERGIDLASLRGTGPEGRIVAEDVQRGEEAPALVAAPAVTVASAPLSSIRKTIARRLTEAWTVPAFMLTVSADMTRANELVARRRELEPDVRVTVTDLLTRVCAQALVRHPGMNVQYTEDALLSFPNANVGIAVAAPQGLVVPVVHNAEQLSLTQIAEVRADLVTRARGAKLRADDIDGGTFTISNLGMFDVDQFVAVLNPPQASILAVGATRDQAVPVDGELHVLPMMTMTLTCDHRAVDGATGAEFLKTIKAFLEDPGLAL
jgi:pyruvate dehydrogenase E2 component (dihydrolipoamide acetyltransferase)